MNLSRRTIAAVVLAGLAIPLAQAQSGARNISVLQDDGTLIVPANPFDLSNRSFVFTPQGSGYTFQTVTGTFDQGAGNAQVVYVGDDDSVQLNLPFSFPFYGASYTTAFLNSDGNITFKTPDYTNTYRDLNSVVKGPPRISGFLDDLIPVTGNGAGVIYAEAFSDRVILYWIGVLEYPSYGTTTFEIIIQKNGIIRINYGNVTAFNAVVGIAPGEGSSFQVVDLSQQNAALPVTGAVAEVFSAQEGLSLSAVAQRFYETHPDNYDAMMVFADFDLNFGIPAYSVPLRNSIKGILPPNYPDFDVGTDYGSASRLSIVVNGGAVSQYPADPYEVFFNSRNTMTVLAQQFGHRWLSYADVNPAGMLRPNSSNWSFLMNAFGSVMEGNEIEDHGDGTFETTGAKYRYSPLDQYLMGLRSPDDVPPWFIVSNPALISAPSDFSCAPLTASCMATAGVVFSGTRRDVTIQNVITAMGQRDPTFENAQKDFALAFVLVTPQGQAASADTLLHLDTVRKEWEKFFVAAVDNRATMTTELEESGFNLTSTGSASAETGGTSPDVQVGYGAVNSGTAVAVLRSFSGEDLVSEAAVPATNAADHWIMYAEKGTNGVSTGVAIANPGSAAANLTLTLSDGRETTLQIPAGGQHAAFVEELFGDFPSSFLGTLTVQSDVPVAVLALRGTLNAKGQFIISTIPLSSTEPEVGGLTAFPIITDGGGYNTELILVNAGTTDSSGVIQFSFVAATDRGTQVQFNFDIPPGGVWRIRTLGTPSEVIPGYASISVSDGPMPNATALIRLSANGDLTSETAVPAQTALTRGLMFGSRETNRRTGIAILNPGNESVTVTLTPLDANRNPVGSAGTITLGGYGQKSAFLDEFISTIPLGFEGTVLLESPSPVFAISLRGTTDAHNGFLMSTLPVIDLNGTYTGAHYFPQLVDGGGYTTEFLLMNNGDGSVRLNFFSSSGQPLTVALQ
jgi:hypothetical protein